jgi:ABC-type molybdenum transport system ATPase subunit/photorepair protein PhrA
VLQSRIERRVADGAAVVIVVHRRGEWPRCATHELHLVDGALRYAGPVRLSRGCFQCGRRKLPGR